MAATIIAAVGAAVAVGALIRAVWEYREQGRQRRAEYFLKMIERFFSDKRFTKLCKLLDEQDEAAISRVPWEDRREFIGFIEEVALLMYSNLLPRKIVYYMFSYYPLRAWESSGFMRDVNKSSTYWIVFVDFVKQMQEFEASPPQVREFRF